MHFLPMICYIGLCETYLQFFVESWIVLLSSSLETHYFTQFIRSIQQFLGYYLLSVLSIEYFSLLNSTEGKYELELAPAGSFEEDYKENGL